MPNKQIQKTVYDHLTPYGKITSIRRNKEKPIPPTPQESGEKS